MAHLRAKLCLKKYKLETWMSTDKYKDGIWSKNDNNHLKSDNVVGCSLKREQFLIIVWYECT